jgi:hypothetical protein
LFFTVSLSVFLPPFLLYIFLYFSPSLSHYNSSVAHVFSAIITTRNFRDAHKMALVSFSAQKFAVPMLMAVNHTSAMLTFRVAPSLKVFEPNCYDSPNTHVHFQSYGHSPCLELGSEIR